MKKYINFKAIALLALLVVIGVSCDTAQQDIEPIVSTDNYPIATFVVSDPIVSEAGGAMVTVDITFDKPIDRSVSFSGVKVAGSATEHEDFEIHGAIVPAFSTSAQLVIEIFEDTEPEGVETIQIQIDRPSLASKYLINPISDLPLIDIEIKNYVSDVLDMVFDFDVDLIYNGDAYSSCSYGVDLDMFVSNAAGFDINDPWATFNGTNYAATGDCPEEFGMDMAAWGDGEYIIWHELWDNVNAGLWEDKPVNITTTFVRAGVFTKTIVQDDTQAMNSNDLGEAQGGTNTHGFIAKVVIGDGKFTISDYNGDEVISGKLPSNKVKTIRPAYLNNKPANTGKLLK
ncbi:MAG: hypothetical protein J7K34_07345 [Flavobacteriaceae bacterium]|nr:hypothetical protein [Flavobacteriaceae bacterium]